MLAHSAALAPNQVLQQSCPASRLPTIQLLRILGWMLLFVLVFQGSRLHTQYNEVYLTLLKCWACICLFFLANVLSALVAKAMSRHFHSISTFLRMQVRSKCAARTSMPPQCLCWRAPPLHWRGSRLLRS